MSDRFGDRAVAYHARVALAAPLAKDYKVLDMGDRMGEMASAKEAGGRLRRAAPRIEEARQLYTSALLEKKDQAIATLGRTVPRIPTDRPVCLVSPHGDPAPV